MQIILSAATETYNDLDVICYMCIDLLRGLGDITGLGYSGINILLFVIIQPLLILFFAITTLVALRTKNDGTKWLIKWSTISTLACCFLFVMLFIVLPFSLYLNGNGSGDGHGDHLSVESTEYYIDMAKKHPLH